MLKKPIILWALIVIGILFLIALMIGNSVVGKANL